MSKPELATSYEIKNIDSNAYELHINGQQFPWHIAEEGPLIDARDGDDWFRLWVPVLVAAKPLQEGWPVGEFVTKGGDDD